MTTYRIEDEDNGMPCGYDYQSFNDGYDCPNDVKKVIISEHPDFHWAHLCEDHAKIEFAKLDQK